MWEAQGVSVEKVVKKRKAGSQTQTRLPADLVPGPWKLCQSKQWVTCDLERRENSGGIPGLPQQLMWSPCLHWWGFWNDLGETLLGQRATWCQDWRMPQGSSSGNLSRPADLENCRRPNTWRWDFFLDERHIYPPFIRISDRKECKECFFWQGKMNKMTTPCPALGILLSQWTAGLHFKKKRKRKSYDLRLQVKWCLKCSRSGFNSGCLTYMANALIRWAFRTAQTSICFAKSRDFALILLVHCGLSFTFAFDKYSK